MFIIEKIHVLSLTFLYTVIAKDKVLKQSKYWIPLPNAFGIGMAIQVKLFMGQ